MSDITDLEIYRQQREAEQPVWRIVKGKCKTCGAEAISVQHEECPLDNTECHRCSAWAFCVTHFVLDGELVPRLELVTKDV